MRIFLLYIQSWRLLEQVLYSVSYMGSDTVCFMIITDKVFKSTHELDLVAAILASTLMCAIYKAQDATLSFLTRRLLTITAAKPSEPVPDMLYQIKPPRGEQLRTLRRLRPWPWQNPTNLPNWNRKPFPTARCHF